MYSFRRYIFHPETKTWLDTVVWSSAQPHSVINMVSQCFEGDTDQLLHVLDRRAMGLPPAEYHTKTKTTKDLNIVWKQFPEYDERSTILVDDSLHKAEHQPFNHIYVAEYTAQRWHTDMASMARERRQAEQTEDEPGAALLSKMLKDLSISSRKDKLPYDTTLLALIGILEQLRDVDDVASWIRKNGLSHGRASNQTHDLGPREPLDCNRASLSSSDSTFAKYWFENGSTVQYWTQAGVCVLEHLGIEVRAMNDADSNV
ncbi:hypothetical protein FISHEDRAFT_51880 [Fistulina hepatica ATCC 64428]|nr:hypothetical protein FISHEDRAFT_51880 [Fistulina hepatica ATCC 64428]